MELAKRAALVMLAGGTLAVGACSSSNGPEASTTATPSAVISSPEASPSSPSPLSNIPRDEKLKASKEPQLAKIGQYESLSGAESVQRASLFVPTPASSEQATAYAAEAAKTLHAFAEADMPALVFIEPANDNGNLDLKKYANGGYDAALKTYFAQLKANGITDKTMGTWVVLPEGNLPEWSSVDPTIYAKTVTRTANIQKQYFPASQTAIMLDSETYPTARSYDGGKYVSLKPYVQKITHGLIDSVGLQGFPEPGVASPLQYLRTDLLAEAAHTLGTKNVWFNTGTFSKEYDSEHHRMLSIPAHERATQLSQVAADAKALQHQGFNVAVHLFAEDKLHSGEKTDWSYWHGTPSADTDASVFTNFAKQLKSDNVALWLFDPAES